MLLSVHWQLPPPSGRQDDARRRSTTDLARYNPRMGRTRCDCMKLSFVGLRSVARREGITDINELIRRTGCCTGCGTCRPHLEEFLKSGEVDVGGTRMKLPEFNWDEFEDEGSEDQRI